MTFDATHTEDIYCEHCGQALPNKANMQDSIIGMKTAIYFLNREIKKQQELLGKLLRNQILKNR